MALSRKTFTIRTSRIRRQNRSSEVAKTSSADLIMGMVILKISFGGIPNSRNVLFLQIFLKRAAKPSPGNTSACSKTSQTFSGTLLNLTWLCTKSSRNLLRNLPRTFSGTFSGTLLNLTWLCTKASRNLLRNLPTLLNLTWLCTKASHTFSGTFVEPALHQSLPDLLRNLLRNPVESDLALHQNLPRLLRNLLRNPLQNLVEPDLALHQGFLEPSLEPSLERC